MSLGRSQLQCMILPCDCRTCGYVYDGEAWGECPVCIVRKQDDRIETLTIAIEQALSFIDEDAPLHAAQALRIALDTL